LSASGRKKTLPLDKSSEFLDDCPEAREIGHSKLPPDLRRSPRLAEIQLMALPLRPNCEYCDKDLPPHSTEARICSYECTFCVDCAENKLANVCPNCGVDLRRGRSVSRGNGVRACRSRSIRHLTSACSSNTPSTTSRRIRKRSGTFRQSSDRALPPVIASEAKQSRNPMDCFVAYAPRNDRMI
jgi:hypothetical protein